MTDKSEFLIMRVFRSEPGDLGIPDRPALPEVENAVQATQKLLESYLPEQGRLRQRMPLRSQLFAYDGRIFADFRLTPSGAEVVLPGSSDAYR